MLSNSREHGHPYLVSHLRGNDFSFSPLRIMFAVGLFYVAFNILCWAFLEAQLVKNPPAIWVTWVRKIPWRRKRLLTPVLWPGEFPGLYSPWGHKESDNTEQFSLSLIC